MRYENTGATESSEDYLEAILVIRRLRGSCRNVDIAERMGVAKPSVTKALGNLARRGLAEVVGRDVRLTEEGGRLAEGRPSLKPHFASQTEGNREPLDMNRRAANAFNARTWRRRRRGGGSARRWRAGRRLGCSRGC